MMRAVRISAIGNGRRYAIGQRYPLGGCERAANIDC